MPGDYDWSNFISRLIVLSKQEKETKMDAKTI